MADAPLLSVIIPVHDSSEYLRQCLNSLIAQKMSDFEVICVDDGSVDSSLDILREYSTKDSRFCFIEQNNLGAGAARNNGLRHARGKYIHFLDSDDWLESEAYEITCNKMAVTGVDVCIFQKYLYDNITGISTPSVKSFDEDEYITNFDNNPSFFIHNVVVPWNKICRRSLIIDNNIWFDEIKCANDRSFYFKLILKAREIMVCKDLLLYYRINNSKSLIGSIRSKYYDAHFFAYNSTIAAYKGKSDEIKRLVIDACLIDMFRFFDRAHPIYKLRIYLQLHEFFQTMDMSSFDEGVMGYSWSDRYRYIRDHKAGLIPFYFKRFAKEIIGRINVDFGKERGKAPIHKGLIISLTSFPDRVSTVHKTVQSILDQTVLPEKIILWLAEEQFPNRKGSLPRALRKLEKKGLDIRFCKDLKPHKKYYYTMLEYPDYTIITIDDDVVYDPDLIEVLLDSYTKFPHAISGMRVHRITFSDGKINPYNSWNFLDETLYNNPSMLAIATGAGGVLYPPGILSKEVFDEDLILKTCLFGDDLWLKVNEVINGIPTVLAGANRKLKYIDGTQESSLWLDNKSGGRNDRQLTDIDCEFIKKYNTSPIELLASEVPFSEISISCVLDCTDVEDSETLLMLRGTMQNHEEMILYDVRDLRVFRELRKYFFYDLSVMILPNDTPFNTPLFFLAECANGKYIRNVSLNADSRLKRVFEDFPKDVLKRGKTYHFQDPFFISIVKKYAGMNNEDATSVEDVALRIELYNSRSVLMLREIMKNRSDVKVGKDYYSRMIGESIIEGKYYGDELTELDVLSVYDCSSVAMNKKLCPVCGRLSLFLPYGKSLRDGVLCPVCGSLERHRAAVLILRKSQRKDTLCDMLFVNPETKMRSALKEVGFKICNIKNISEVNGKYDSIIHCHTLKKDNQPDSVIANTVLKLKEGGVIFITLPVKNIGKEVHYVPELDISIYNYRDVLERYGLRVHMKWGVDTFSPNELKLYGLNGKDLLIVCTKEG